MVVLFSVVMITVRVMFSLIAKEKINIYQELKKLLYVIYCFALFKLVTTTDFESFSNNFMPFREMTRYEVSSPLFFRNVLGNICLFIPFGYLITDMFWERTKKATVFIPLIVVVITSLTIEIIQMYIGRSFDIDDIILNFIGGLVGYLFFVVLHKIMDILKR